MIQHKCGICNELILLDNDAIKMHLRKPGHWVTPKEYISNYMKDSRMPESTVEQEDDEESLTRAEQQTADILANLDDIVIPTMDTDACADIAEDDPLVAVEECKVTSNQIVIINIMKIAMYTFFRLRQWNVHQILQMNQRRER